MADASALRERVVTHYGAVFEEATRLMVAELRAVAPEGETGDTRRGIDAVPGGSPLRPAATVRSLGKGGDFVEAGTVPHEIRPRNGQALRFLGGGRRVSQPAPSSRVATRAGGVVFAKVVRHPGTPARPWFRPVVGRFGEFLERAAARVR